MNPTLPRNVVYVPHRRAPRLALALLLLILAAPSRALAGGDAACCALRPQDEVWLISSRGLGCDAPQQVNHLQYWRYDCEQAWVPSDLASLLANDNSLAATMFFVHGNRVSCDEAFAKGWSAYRALVRCADERPVRFIIWSWPSDAVRGPVNDVREKAERTNPTAFYLAWVVDQLDADVPVGLWGHSFGARVVSGSLHLLGGGEAFGYHLTERAHPQRQPMQAVLLAAAVDCDWLLPGHCHGQALNQVNSLLLINNSCDALLKRYHLLYGRRSCAEALGYTGMSIWSLPRDMQSSIVQIDACSYVGRQHTFDNYLCSAGLLDQIRAALLPTGSAIPEEVEPTKTAEDVTAEEVTAEEATSEANQGPELGQGL